jgi:hypothetical protein
MTNYVKARQPKQVQPLWPSYAALYNENYVGILVTRLNLSVKDLITG